MMHLAVLGASGYVGKELCQTATLKGHKVTRLGRLTCDIYDVDVLTDIIAALTPNALINCAGYTGTPNVDACELDKTNCLLANAVLPGVVAEACERTKTMFGHISSGCIYCGSKPNGLGFDENDVPNFTFRENNCSFYSGSKAMGEEILQRYANSYVWRLRMPFSHIDSPRNLLSKLLRYDRLLEAENSLTYLPEFCSAVINCIEWQLPFGIYHLTNPGSVRTSAIAGLMEKHGIARKEFEYFESDSDFRAVVLAPRSNCILDSSKAAAFGLMSTPILERLNDAMKNWQASEVCVVERERAGNRGSNLCTKE